jgi:hypothetical protein
MDITYTEVDLYPFGWMGREARRSDGGGVYYETERLGIICHAIKSRVCALDLSLCLVGTERKVAQSTLTGVLACIDDTTTVSHKYGCKGEGPALGGRGVGWSNEGSEGISRCMRGDQQRGLRFSIG